MAFQPENEQGYVFYFLQEILRLFGAPACRVRPPWGRNLQKAYVMEMDNCHYETVEHCLERNYRRWYIDESTLHYLIIELIDRDAEPQEHINFRDRPWSLTSMIVFDCSHFVSYHKRGDQWFLYDDNRSLMHSPLQPYEFGQHYNRGACHFQYGRKNTFFFYAPAK